LAGNPLVGTGFESFWLGRRLEAAWGLMVGLQEAHNGYLEVYLNLGWIGVMLLSVVIVAGYRNVMAAFRMTPTEGNLKLAYFVVGMVYNLTEAGFRMMSSVWLLFLWAITAVPKPLAKEMQSNHFIVTGQ
jgi:O-antigen ligase